LPGARTHRRESLKHLGQFTPWLQRIIDAPSKGELKSQHRLLFHDWDFVLLIEDKMGRDIAREALLHIILDLEQYREVKKKLIR